MTEDTEMKTIPRRTLLKNSALATAGTLAIRKSSASPNEKLNLALIGLNGIGSFHLRNLVKRDDCVIGTLCDIDESVLDRAAGAVKEATSQPPNRASDFRSVFEDKSIDAVIIATPHHWHIPIAVRALRAGKDVYVEKPASHVFREGQLLIEAARKYDRIVQHGTQKRSSEVTERAMEVLASGIIGEIKMSKAWNIQRNPPPPVQPDGRAPSGVNYDMWLGPASKRAFNPNRFHRTWRQYREYGNGDIGDDGAHDIDLAALGLGVETHPVRVTSHGSSVDLKGDREFPDNMMVAYHYADGKVLLYEDRQWTPYKMQGFDSGNAFYGTDGYMIFSRREYFQVYLGPKEEKGPGMRIKDVIVPTTVRHMTNFFESIRSRKPTAAPPEVAHRTCTLIHLGETAYRVKRVLDFDPASETISNDPEASALLTKHYRAPWSLTELS